MLVKAEVGFPTTDQGFSSIQGTVFGFYGILISFDACNIYRYQAWTNANDKMTVEDYFFFTKHHAYRKILKYKLCTVVDPSRKVPDLNCEVQDLLLEVVDLKLEVPDLRSSGMPPPQFNGTPALAIHHYLRALGSRECLPPGANVCVAAPPVRSAIDILMVTTMALMRTVTNSKLGV